MPRIQIWCVVLLVAGCGSADAVGERGTLTTVFDSTADTVSARVAGDLPADAVRQLVTEVAIAPGIDDTTLFTRVSEFDVDHAGRFWVFDNDSRAIFVFGSDGTLIRRIGREGGGPGEFEQNGGMVLLADGRLAQWDSRNARISFFDSTGSFITSWPVPGGFSTSNGLYTDAGGALYLRRPVTPPREGEILGRMGLVRLVEGGAFADSLVPPDLPVPREVYVARREGSTSSTGSTYGPNHFWAWTPSGEFVAAHGGNYEMVVVRNEAKPLVIRRTMTPVPIDPAEREWEAQNIAWSLRQTDPNWSWQGPPIPSTKAPMRGLQVTRDGRIWVQVAVPSDTIPVAERQEFPDSLRPVPAHRMSPVYEVFAPSGEFLGRVTLPPLARLVEADGNTVWGLDRDENDMPAVTRWRVEPGWSP
jgi:hypothetical protein